MLLKSKSSPIQELVNLFRLHGTDLVVEDEAVNAMVRIALQEKTGARAVLEVVWDRMLPVINRLTELKGIKRVIVDAAMITTRHYPWLIPGDPVVEPIDLEKAAPPASMPGTKRRMSQITRVSDTKGWSEERIRTRLKAVLSMVGYDSTTDSVRRRFDELIAAYTDCMATVLRVAEELAVRNATIAQLFQAQDEGKTNNPQAMLHYLDYDRARRQT
jgi:hypothetical protein